MPNEGNGESGANETPIAEQAGAAVEQQVAAVETGAQAAIDVAAAEAEQARQTSEQLAAAALEGQRGQEIQALRAEQTQWQERTAKAEQEVGTLRQQYSTLETSFGELKGLLAGLTAPTPSTPPNNPAPPQTSAPVVEPDNQPNNRNGGEDPPEAENHPRKRVRRLL